MRISGRIRKSGRHWLVEVPILDAMTQGRTRAEAIRMAVDLVETMAGRAGFSVGVRVGPRGEVRIETSDVAVLLGVVLRRQREKHGVSLVELAKRLGCRSVFPYARYERGRTVPSISKLFEFLEAIAPGEGFVLHSLPRTSR